MGVESGGKTPTIYMCWKAMLFPFNKEQLMGESRESPLRGRRACATTASALHAGFRRPWGN